jgi:hypothetical protein
MRRIAAARRASCHRAVASLRPGVTDPTRHIVISFEPTDRVPTREELKRAIDIYREERGLKMPNLRRPYTPMATAAGILYISTSFTTACGQMAAWFRIVPSICGLPDIIDPARFGIAQGLLFR